MTPTEHARRLERDLAAALALQARAADLCEHAEAAAAVHAARVALVRLWTKLAYKAGNAAYRRAGKLGDRDEWCQAALMGLLDAAGLILPDPDNWRTRRRKFGPNNGRYDPASGFAFPTYASHYLRKWLQEYAHDLRCGAVKRPRPEKDAAGEYPEVPPVHGFPTNPEGDTWEPPARPDQWADAPDAGELWAAVDAALADDRERMVVWLRYRCEYTLDRIGDSLGVSKERIRQILGKAMGRLRGSAAVARFAGEAA